MKDEKKHPEAIEEPLDEAEATPSKPAAAAKPLSDDEVEAYAEPSDGSGGGK